MCKCHLAPCGILKQLLLFSLLEREKSRRGSSWVIGDSNWISSQNSEMWTAVCVMVHCLDEGSINCFDCGVYDGALSWWRIHQLSWKSCSVKAGMHMRTKQCVNGLQTKCAYVWIGLQTCATQSANGSHTVRRKPEFFGFLCKHEGNGVCHMSCIRLRFGKN